MAAKKSKKQAPARADLATRMAGMTLEAASTSAQPNPPPVSRKTVVQDFARYFGSESKLENWQRLCRDVGIEDEPGSITQCKLQLRKVWINIYDFLDAVRQDKIPRRFHSERALSQYTIQTDRVYPKKKAKEGGPVRALLAHIF